MKARFSMFGKFQKRMLILAAMVLVALVGSNIMLLSRYTPAEAAGRCYSLMMCGGGGSSSSRSSSNTPVIYYERPEPVVVFEPYQANAGGSSSSSSQPAREPEPPPRSREEEPDPPAQSQAPPSQPQPTAAPLTCSPSYDPPILDGGGQEPPYPLTIGQDPDKLGVNMFFSGTGGAKNNGCNEGPARSPIVDFRVISVELTPETVAWITGELADIYPGAHVKDDYPFSPSVFETQGMFTGSASLEIHIDPLDPGDYVVSVRLAQEDGQADVRAFPLKVWLFEATITGP